MPQVSAITQAIRSAGLTPTGLKDLLLTVDAEASATTKARIKVILDGLCNLPLTEGRAILKETAKEAKDTPQAKTVKQRVSECRQLYGAVKLIQGFRDRVENDGLGWAPAVNAARQALEGANLKADGGRAESPEEKAAKALEKATQAVAAEMLAANADETLTVNALMEAAKERARDQAVHARVKAHADRIMKAEGTLYGEMLANALLNWEPTPEQA